MLSCDGACNKLLNALNNYKSFEQCPLLFDLSALQAYTTPIKPTLWFCNIPKCDSAAPEHSELQAPMCAELGDICVGAQTGDVRLPSGKQCLPLGERQFLPVEQKHWCTARN